MLFTLRNLSLLASVAMLSACDGSVTPVTDAAMDVPVRGITSNLAFPPTISCNRIEFVVAIRGIDPQPASAFSYTITTDAIPDAGVPPEVPFDNTCFEQLTLEGSGTPAYRVCAQNLMPRTNYVIRVRVGFDGGLNQPQFRFGTPDCSMDASVD